MTRTAFEPIHDFLWTDATRPLVHVVGLHHAETPIAVRERYALDFAAAAKFMRSLLERGIAEQAMALSTCNRVEVYAASAGENFPERLREAFLELGGGDPAPQGLFMREGAAAARHIIEVCSGLDSMMLGETQIKRQLRDAYELARECATLGSELHMLVEAAFRAGKRVRTETELNEGTLCLARACVMKGEQALGGLRGRRCLILGAGKIGGIAAREIAARQPEKLWVLNRSLDRADELAREFGGEAHPLEALHALLPQTDFLLAAAYAPEFTLRREAYEAALALHSSPPVPAKAPRVCMVDAAVPRSLDPALCELPGVRLFDIEHLTEIVELNRRRRSAAAERARGIVAEEAEAYREMTLNAQLGPAIAALQRRSEADWEAEIAMRSEGLEPESASRAARELRRAHDHELHRAITELKVEYQEQAAAAAAR